MRTRTSRRKFEQGPLPLAEATAVREAFDNSDAQLGEQIRALRAANNMTIKQVAERANVSVGTISQIERGICSPSVRSLRQISEALGVSVGYFFRPNQSEDDEVGIVVRRPTRSRISFQTHGVVKELLTPDLSGALEVLFVSIEPGASSGRDLYSHDGEEAGVVLKGTLELWVEKRRLLLGEGDSFRFSSTRPHRFSNPGKARTEVIWIITPPLY